MHFRKLFLSLLYSVTLFAQSYNFSELRYSDALNRYSQLDGRIEFTQDGLNILYPKQKKELEYNGQDVIIKEGKKELDLPSQQKQYMMQYFEILKMLHAGDEAELRDEFTIQKEHYKTVLYPIGNLKYYIKSIELTKEKGLLNYVKLFLKNNDTITIHIEK
jgi:hypothetical protein